MFQPFRREPKAYETTAQNTSGALAQLMAALQGAAQGGADISKNAGTSIARDRLAAMSPEDRNSIQVTDKLGGLALTDQFRKRLEQGEQDAVAKNVADAKNTFITERDAKLNQYAIDADKRRLSRELATAKAGGKGTLPTISEEERNQIESELPELDKLITEYDTAIYADDTQDEIGLGDKKNFSEQAKKLKYDRLLKLGYNQVTAKDMAFGESPGMKALRKRLTGSVEAKGKK